MRRNGYATGSNDGIRGPSFPPFTLTGAAEQLPRLASP